MKDKYSDKVAVSTWDILFNELGIYYIHEHLKALFGDNILDYMQWTESACNALKSHGLDEHTFNKIIYDRKITPGAIETLNILKKNNIKTCILTGSFEKLALRAKEELGVDFYYAHCKLIFDANGKLVSWNLQRTDYEDKAKFVRSLAKAINVDLKECVFIGDDVNDISGMKNIGLSIAFKAEKTKVRNVASIKIDEGELTEILKYIGL